MDAQFWKSLIQLLIFLPFILFLIYLLGKLTNKFYISPPGRYMKIVERLQLSKDSFIMVIKIGDKGYLMSSSNNKTEILKELTEEELLKAEQNGKQYYGTNFNNSSNFVTNLIRKNHKK
ncbi:flagellar biosynthesis, FliO family protein [Clostridium argentinense CDC 2741]|uniref:Flagellar biosynthesis, FliO family protein n=1 Tax=Clostridium argentinense CDC 2741 TaxID=1418104 RepID=A0A0C1R1M7_9CLOT|nr:flagellar biosynthetic protein FliO [Clostridium argentinense]ARC85294.1 hypothetical protein RSJ17_12690 [Clostridium argentinense]KIE47332.1 flagellar biosynthesis, FliO family protein [Clostridium argentinense CDC 2741]NFF40915.1 flagellar biosynthesis protein FliZ [Clostridium argentinense]NFP51374.1 flagellar biosynthesis protein FliZ [Clostridium argentinense]NFP73412.1 flagellar biosynthesis protein FliZ [Clostridium argentinense]